MLSPDKQKNRFNRGGEEDSPFSIYKRTDGWLLLGTKITINKTIVAIGSPRTVYSHSVIFGVFFEGYSDGISVRTIPGRLYHTRIIYLRFGQQATVRVRTLVGALLSGPVDAHRRPIHTHRAQAVQVQT